MLFFSPFYGCNYDYCIVQWLSGPATGKLTVFVYITLLNCSHNSIFIFIHLFVIVVALFVRAFWSRARIPLQINVCVLCCFWFFLSALRFNSKLSVCVHISVLFALFSVSHDDSTFYAASLFSYLLHIYGIIWTQNRPKRYNHFTATLLSFSLSFLLRLKITETKVENGHIRCFFLFPQ